MSRSIALRSALTGAVAALALLALPAHAQWKWRDAAGHVQYSDLPPPSGTPEKDILARPAVQQRRAEAAATAALAPASAASAAAKAVSGALAPRVVEPELEAKRKQMEAEQAAKKKADDDRIAAARADNCKRARNQVATLESGVRLARTNDKGEREILDDAARDAEMKRNRDVVANDCK